MSGSTEFAVILREGPLRVLVLASRALGGGARSGWTEMPSGANDCAMTSGTTRAVVSNATFRAGTLRVRTRLVVVLARRTRILYTVLRLARAPMPRRAQVCLIVDRFLQAIMACWTRFAARRAHCPRKIVVGSSWTWNKPRGGSTETSRRTKIFCRILHCCWKCAVKARIALRTQTLPVDTPKSHGTGSWQTISMRAFVCCWAHCAVAAPYRTVITSRTRLRLLSWISARKPRRANQTLRLPPCITSTRQCGNVSHSERYAARMQAKSSMVRSKQGGGKGPRE
jgi:hypothetical protein